MLVFYLSRMHRDHHNIVIEMRMMMVAMMILVFMITTVTVMGMITVMVMLWMKSREKSGG